MTAFFQDTSIPALSFDALPETAQKAVVWRWVMECGNDLITHVDSLLPDAIDSPHDIDGATWAQILAMAATTFSEYRFYYREIPTEEVTSTLLRAHEELREYACWADYQTNYGTKDVPAYPEAQRWPCLAPIGDPMLIDDGWHRLHSYINQGHATIPVLAY